MPGLMNFSGKVMPHLHCAWLNGLSWLQPICRRLTCLCIWILEENFKAKLQTQLQQKLLALVDLFDCKQIAQEGRHGYRI